MLDKLVNIINMYKAKKISKFVVEKEIEMEMATNIDVNAEVVDNPVGGSVVTFGVAMLPDKRNGKFKLNLLIDDAMLQQDVVDSKNIVTMLALNMRQRDSVIRILNELLTDKLEYASMTLILKSLIDIYEVSLRCNTAVCQDSKFARNLPDINVLEADKKMLDNDDMRLEEKREKLVNDKVFPPTFLDYADYLMNLCQGEFKILLTTNGEEKPNMNIEYENIRQYAAPPYNDPYKRTEIPYNYLPKT